MTPVLDAAAMIREYIQRQNVDVTMNVLTLKIAAMIMKRCVETVVLKMELKEEVWVSDDL